MTIQTDLVQIKGYLASAMNVNPSELSSGEPRNYTDYKQGNSFSTPISLNGQEVAEVIASDKGGISTAYLHLPLPKEMKSYAPFSLDLDGSRITYFKTTYYIDRHPEFKEVLEELRQKKRIPREMILGAMEPRLYGSEDDLAGIIKYFLGVPPEERLCIQVDKEILEYVPEAQEQVDQQHSCMHGESAPYNPFETNPKGAEKLSSVHIELQSADNVGSQYLRKTLEGLLVPADGLVIARHYDGHFGRVGLDPVIPFIDILLDAPQNRENFEDMVRLVRGLEEIFK